MPRIAREEHARIRERVEVGGEKVAGVAASYGCTPANIYAILAKLRQAGEAGSAEPVASAADPAPALPRPIAAAVPEPDMISAGPRVPTEADPKGAPLEEPMPAKAVPVPVTPPPLPKPSASRERSPSPAPRGFKAGHALMMRTGDGEEAVNPFRSLEDLLSAAKPILRNAARSPEPVWFSIQPVDLDALEDAF